MEHTRSYKFGQILGNTIFAICIGLVFGFAISYWKYALFILIGGFILVSILRHVVEAKVK